MLPTDLPNLLNRIEKRRRADRRTELIIAYNSHDKDLTQQLLDQWADHDEGYVSRPYDKGAMEMFKNTVESNRASA